jgi:NAD(P)-dependent dehydrogenase (short-subunit alcohol dehydrogenase family)
MPFSICSNSTLETNVYGPLMLMQAVLPAMRRHAVWPDRQHVSSTLGAFADILDPASPYGAVDSPAYRFSKGALNLLTALFARERGRQQHSRQLLPVPGWVSAGCGSERAPLSAEQGADTPVWLATLPDAGPSGGFFRERAAHSLVGERSR